MVEVVAALIWADNKFMICQRPAHKARALLWEFVNEELVEVGAGSDDSDYGYDDYADDYSDDYSEE